jgi:uncharacterized phage-associated protein
MHDAIALANWLLAAVSPRMLNHLQLQKLVFYAYGAAAAEGLEAQLGDVRFVAWKHGPVNRALYEQHRGSGRAPLAVPPPGDVPAYGDLRLTGVLRDVLAVYGRLTPWQLREESHLEQPWAEAEQSEEISDEAIKVHFCRKFARGAVALPRNLLGAWSFDADAIPTQRWESLHEIAVALSA